MPFDEYKSSVHWQKERKKKERLETFLLSVVMFAIYASFATMIYTIGGC